MNAAKKAVAIAVAAAIVVFAAAPPARAQTPGSQPITLGGMAVSGSLRIRSYSWDWFGENPNGDYTYPALLARVGLSQSTKTFDWQVEFAAPLMANLPASAVTAPPQGQLGAGASYYAANGSANAGEFFLKQGFVRFKGLAGVAGQSLKVGRMEFSDGAEVVPKNGTLAALKRDRISQRLLGPVGFSDVGRTIDGAQYSLTGRSLNLTVIGGRPTRGVYDVNGWPELNINLFFGAVTAQVGSDAHPGEWRLFALGFDDYRHGVVKTDNRPAAARAADTGSIAIGTYGGHYLQLATTPAGPVDLLAWGAIQTGSWGALTQRAGAYAVEAGWQPKGADALKPWLRGGFDYGSGDGSTTDATHGTFFQVLPTARLYGRLPFFTNLMNSGDAFGELLLRPHPSVTIRADAHVLRLADAHDLWYSGSGPFQPATFGYTGRPSNGQTRFATLYDVSGDYTINAHLALSVYYGHGVSQNVTQAIYAGGSGSQLAYVELLFRL